MSNILESPDWKKIERESKRAPRTIAALALYTALRTATLVDGPLLEAAQTQADVFRHGFMSLEQPTWSTASASEKNALFDPHIKPLQLTGEQVAAVVAVIADSQPHS